MAMRSLGSSSSWILRQARSNRSPALSITTPQHSPGYSAIAWARMRAYSSGVRIIERESTAEESRPAPREGWNDRHLVPVLERGLQALERLDRLAVDVDIHVDAHVRLLRI